MQLLVICELSSIRYQADINDNDEEVLLQHKILKYLLLKTESKMTLKRINERFQIVFNFQIRIYSEKT